MLGVDWNTGGGWGQGSVSLARVCCCCRRAWAHHAALKFGMLGGDWNTGGGWGHGSVSLACVAASRELGACLKDKHARRCFEEEEGGASWSPTTVGMFGCCEKAWAH